MQTVPSSASQGRFRGGLLVLLWWALCLPATIAIPAELERGNFGILAVLALDAVGLYLLYLVFRDYLDWRRYGRSPLLLHEYPLVTGRPMVGEIRFARPLPARSRVRVTLNQVHSAATGSGSSPHRNRVVEWQDHQHVSPESFASGSRLRFRFELPADRPASEEPARSFRYWELHVAGPDLKPPLPRHYDIRVEQGASSENAVDRRLDAAADEAGQDTAQTWGLRWGPGGLERYEGLAERWRPALGVLLFAAGFGTACALVWGLEEIGRLRWPLVVPFGLASSAILLYGLFLLLGSQRLTVSHRGLCSQHNLLGMPVYRREIAAGDVGRVVVRRTGQVNRQGETFIEWAVIAEDRSGKAHVRLVEGLVDLRVAGRALHWFHRHGPFPMPIEPVDEASTDGGG